MAGTSRTSNRNTILIIAAVAAVLLICCCVIAAAAGALLIVRSESGAEQIIITPTPGSAAPGSGTGPITINSFRIDPERIVAGECAVLDWDVAGAETVQLSRDDLVILDNAGLMDSYKDCPDQPGVYRYQLQVENSSGFYQWMELQLIVDAGSNQ